MLFHYFSNNIIIFWYIYLNAKAIVLILLLAAKESEKTKYIEAALYPIIANAISQYENEVSASEL